MLKYLYNVTGAKRASDQPMSTSDDVCEAVSASELLEITEFRLFELAYREWFGREADQAALEPPFVQYMFAQQAPAWVRHFARNVIACDRDGRLERAEFGLPPAPKKADADAVRACNDILMALWFAGAYAVWSFQGV